MMIYLITNLINNKKYVGQTVESLEKRYSRHCDYNKYNKCMPIVRAIKKYNSKNFQIEKIDTASSLEELNKKETENIIKYNTLVPNGYNLTLGGDNNKMHESTKRKISKKLSGKPKSAEHIRKVISSRQKTYENNPDIKTKLSFMNKGKILNENIRKNLSLKKDKSSQYLGVIFTLRNGNTYWRSELYHQGKRLHATFNTELEAAHCYDMFLVKVGLNPINFPIDVWTEEYINSIRRKKTRKSKYYGIQITKYGKFQVLIWYEKKKLYLGSFDSEKEAADVIKEFYINHGK